VQFLSLDPDGPEMGLGSWELATGRPVWCSMYGRREFKARLVPALPESGPVAADGAVFAAPVILADDAGRKVRMAIVRVSTTSDRQLPFYASGWVERPARLWPVASLLADGRVVAIDPEGLVHGLPIGGGGLSAGP